MSMRTRIPIHDDYGEEHEQGPERCPMCGGIDDNPDRCEACGGILDHGDAEGARSADSAAGVLLRMLAVTWWADPLAVMSLLTSIHPGRGEALDTIAEHARTAFEVCTKQAVSRARGRLAESFPDAAELLVSTERRSRS